MLQKNANGELMLTPYEMMLIETCPEGWFHKLLALFGIYCTPEKFVGTSEEWHDDCDDINYSDSDNEYAGFLGPRTARVDRSFELWKQAHGVEAYLANKVTPITSESRPVIIPKRPWEVQKSPDQCEDNTDEPAR